MRGTGEGGGRERVEGRAPTATAGGVTHTPGVSAMRTRGTARGRALGQRAWSRWARGAEPRKGIGSAAPTTTNAAAPHPPSLSLLPLRSHTDAPTYFTRRPSTCRKRALPREADRPPGRSQAEGPGGADMGKRKKKALLARGVGKGGGGGAVARQGTHTHTPEWRVGAEGQARVAGRHAEHAGAWVGRGRCFK